MDARPPIAAPVPDGPAALGLLTPYVDFEEAGAEILAHLQARHGMGLWMLTRTVGEDWVVLDTADRAYDVDGGAVFAWSDSFCSRMVGEGAPRVAPRSDEVPAYASAPIGEQVPIGSYLGVPLVDSDGELFGTLCAIDPEPATDRLHEALPEAELLGRLLMTILAAERAAYAQAHCAAVAADEARTDALCAIANRRGWQDAVDAEEARCRRYGDTAGVVVGDMDGLKEINDTQGHAAGDVALAQAAAVLAASVRDVDAVARTGGDEFGVLLVRSDEASTALTAERIRAALQDADISMSIGWAVRDARRSMDEALRLADVRMYEAKQSVRTPRSLRPVADPG